MGSSHTMFTCRLASRWFSLDCGTPGSLPREPCTPSPSSPAVRACLRWGGQGCRAEAAGVDQAGWRT
jgi:hypothetical protein